MKRIALVLIVGLSATVAQGDEFDIVDYGIFRSIDPLAQRDEWGTTHQTPHAYPRSHWALARRLFLFEIKSWMVLSTYKK